MGFGWQEIDKTLDLGYIRVAGLHRGCKPTVLFDPPNFLPRTMTHVCIVYILVSWCAGELRVDQRKCADICDVAQVTDIHTLPN